MSEQITEIKKLVITINGRESTISIDDAKRLHTALAELFAKETEKIWYPVYRQTHFDRWIPMWQTDTNIYTSAASGYRNTLRTYQGAIDTLKLSAK